MWPPPLGRTQELCHRQPLGIHEQYCKNDFLPRFGNANNTATHWAFVSEHCKEKSSRSLTAENSITDPVAFLRDSLSYVGITEHFLESVCLLLYQVRHHT